MATERYLIELEKRIRKKLRMIRETIITPMESKIGLLINPLKHLDEPLYDELIEEYKNILKNLVD